MFRLLFGKQAAKQKDPELVALLSEVQNIDASVWRYNVGSECFARDVDHRLLFQYAFHLGTKRQLITVKGLHNAWERFNPSAGDIVIVTTKAKRESEYHLLGVARVISPPIKKTIADSAIVACDIEYSSLFTKFSGGLPVINGLSDNPAGGTNFERLKVDAVATALFKSGWARNDVENLFRQR